MALIRDECVAEGQRLKGVHYPDIEDARYRESERPAEQLAFLILPLPGDRYGNCNL
jgi:hypothetical protein